MVVEHLGFCQEIARPLHLSIDPMFLLECSIRIALYLPDSFRENRLWN